MFNKLVALLHLAPLIKETIDLFKSPEPLPQQVDKKRDTTRFNEYHKAVIRAEYAAALIHNETNYQKITNKELADLLNQKFGLNKSVRAYSRIWNQSEET